LFAIPILIWVGVGLSQAVAILSLSIFIQVLVATYQLRDEVRWRQVLPATLIRYLTIPIGISLLLAIDSLDRTQVKQILGVLLLLVVLVQLLVKVKPREELHPGWMALAFLCSGVMHGMAAMGGPPVVLWVMAHRWSNRQTRAFMLALFLLAAPLQLTLLYLFSGGAILGALLTGLAFAPLVALGSTLGVRLGNYIAKKRLRQIAYGILLVTALASILAPIVG
jgi:uncharacterized membrane protein YfcA